MIEKPKKAPRKKKESASVDQTAVQQREPQVLTEEDLFSREQIKSLNPTKQEIDFNPILVLENKRIVEEMIKSFGKEEAEKLKKLSAEIQRENKVRYGV